LELCPEDGHLGGLLRIRARGEQAEELLFPARVAAVVVLAHADVVHVGAAMNGTFGVGLGDDQRRAVQDAMLQCRRQIAHARVRRER